MSGNGILAIHVGAGCHSSSLRSQYNRLMKDACKEAVKILNNGGSALDVVCLATSVLENSPLTNAAFGSSLTMDGMVECDAGVMDGKSLRHAAVGAVSGVINPVILAKEIFIAQAVPLPGGLVSPSFLSGAGARQWASEHNIEVCPPQSLISEKARQTYEESVRHIRNLASKYGRKCFNHSHANKGEGLLLDTVGAVCVDQEGNVASCVSSGGILLKHPGRIGQAAVYGCGMWAQNDFDRSGVNVCVSTSGCGEHLIRTTFAKVCARATFTTDPLGASLARDVRTNFIESPFLQDVDSPMGGALTLRFDSRSNTADLFWFHTTPSMGVAYIQAGKSNVQALFSDLPVDRVGRTVMINCKSFASSEESERNQRIDMQKLTNSVTLQENYSGVL